MPRRDTTIEVRDNRGGDWYWTPNAIIDHYGPLIGAYGVAVYSALSRYANNEAQAWPSIHTLAKQLAIAPNTVRRALADLETHGLVSVTRRRTERDLNMTSVYTLLKVDAPRSTAPDEVLPEVKHGTAPDEPGVLHHVKEGTSPREPKQDSINKTHLNKTQGTRGGATSAPAPNEPVDPPVKASRRREKPLTDEEQAYYAETVPALAAACHMDLGIEGAWAQCQKQLRALYNAQVRPTAALIAREYGQPTGYWYAQDWRGQKGEPPTPHFVTNTWGAATTFKAAAPVANGHARPAASKYDRSLEVLRRRMGQADSADPSADPNVIEGRVVYGNR